MPNVGIFHLVVTDENGDEYEALKKYFEDTYAHYNAVKKYKLEGVIEPVFRPAQVGLRINTADDGKKSVVAQLLISAASLSGSANTVDADVILND